MFSEDAKSMTTDELVAFHSRVSAIPADERCDNDAPGTCCDSCDLSIAVAELTERLSVPVTTTQDGDE